MKKIVSVTVLDHYRLRLRFNDGVEGEVDFSKQPRTGVYAPWRDYGWFRRAHVGEYGELRWDDQLDFSPDALWLQVTGKRPEDLAADPNPALAHA